MDFFFALVLEDRMCASEGPWDSDRVSVERVHQALNPKPLTLSSEPQTLNPKP